MIKTTAMLLEELSEYGSPKSKLSRMAKSGEYFPITKGIYETNRHTPATYSRAAFTVLPTFPLNML